MASQSYPLPVAPPMAVVLGAVSPDLAVDDTGEASVLAAGDMIAGATRGIIQNIGSKACTITNGTLTDGNGIYLAAGESWHFYTSQAPGAICASGETTTLRIVQVS